MRLSEKTGVLTSMHIENVCGVTQVTVQSASVPLVSIPADRLLTNWPEASEYIVKVDLNTSSANTGESLRNFHVCHV